MTSSAPARLRKRLLKELALSREGNGGHGVDLRPLDDNLMTWTARLRPTAPSLYDQGAFYLRIEVPSGYPFQPPVCVFTTPLAHPNVHARTGDICLDVLRTSWSPSWTLHSACLAILVLLEQPDDSSPLNCDAGNLLRSGDTKAYQGLVRLCTRLYAAPR